MIVDKIDSEASEQCRTSGSAVGGPVPLLKITFSAIQRARLDKLLADMVTAYDKEVVSAPLRGKVVETGLGSEIEVASTLQKHWQSRFESEYYRIDKYRFDKLMTGPLRDVVWSATATEGLGVWAPGKVIEISEAEGNTAFVPGHWWLNIGCAHRDGIVGAASEHATKGRYGIAALALLTGREEDMPDGKTLYVREGRADEMHMNLITQVGQKIRILRGFRLQSVLAPAAGVRYDGLYIMQSWSLKLNMVNDMYALRLTLERMPNQGPLEQITAIPKPSQLDDWNLYEQLERTQIKNTEGQVRLNSWTVARDVERFERDLWRRSRESKVRLCDKIRDDGSGSTTPQRRKLSDIETDLMPPIETDEEQEEQE
ncbi:PUA-like domain-containing protein [Coniella lustricola]|uniref:PUA-like domain-containing protein n=1 Tax=Coniella lustricola TaxID=2025994 RepID=A0A2T3AFB8_9PEZI|nr:PUA-like domain-containing protein [Coniella lustricola]